MKKVLVTGGTGYIGSHTVVELIQAGYNPIILDDLSNSSKQVIEGIKKITGVAVPLHVIDLKDSERVDDFFKTQKIDSIIHFAASKAVGESVEYPLKYYRNNLVGLLNVLDGMLKYNVKNIIFSSSCTVYGIPINLPVTELEPVKRPESPYGNTKKIAEEFLFDFGKVTKGVNIISLRYFNPIGAHDSLNIGENPMGVPNNLVPYIVQVGTGERDSLKVFGDDYNTKDGTCVRDYLHVVDLARAHVASLNRLVNENNKSDYEVFNLGTGQGYSVLQVINAFEKVSNKSLKYEIFERRDGDIPEIYADATLAQKELNWKAELTLEQMLESAWKWQLNKLK